jgi:hypothetical protein
MAVRKTQNDPPNLVAEMKSLSYCMSHGVITTELRLPTAPPIKVHKKRKRLTCPTRML